MATNVPLSAINDEYLMWDLTILDDALLASISKHGILAPLACIRFNHEYYVVDGYQRLRIARTLQLKTIPCYDIQPDIPISDVVYQLQQSKLNQSTILRLRYTDHLELMLLIQLLINYLFPSTLILGKIFNAFVHWMPPFNNFL